MKLFLDTHVIIWLFIREPFRFPAKALKLIDSSEIFIPTISLLELQFLFEIGKITVEPNIIVDDLKENIALLPLHTDFTDLIRTAMSISWTRDPFDRMIVAETVFHNAKLLTKDNKILNHFSNAIWA